LLLFALAAGALAAAEAQEIHGTIRGKYEWQTAEREGRFEVRTARVNLTGTLAEWVDYKAEVDLCDEGKIKMLDAYARLRPLRNFSFTLGQMRVPFTIDAHRSPHLQYFANRSFIAKQVGNVRDVGAAAAYRLPLAGENAGAKPAALVLEAGLFNGSGLTGQKDFWTRSVNFSAKAQLQLPIRALQTDGEKDIRGLNVTLSAQKVKPDGVTVMMLGAGTFLQGPHLHAEVEYLRKTYAHGAFPDVHAVDAFVAWRQPVDLRLLKAVTPLVRCDFMTDHSDGTADEETGRLQIDDCKRLRWTAGVTISLLWKLQTDLRVNFEHYHYSADAAPKVSERDKLVLELVTHF